MLKFIQVFDAEVIKRWSDKRSIALCARLSKVSRYSIGFRKLEETITIRLGWSLRSYMKTLRLKSIFNINSVI